MRLAYYGLPCLVCIDFRAYTENLNISDGSGNAGMFIFELVNLAIYQIPQVLTMI